MKFAMGNDVLSRLGQQTSSRSDELVSLVHQLADAGAPLESKFNGAGRAAFDRFKANVDQVGVELSSALNAVLEGIRGQDVAFQSGDQSMSEDVSRLQGSSDFDAARFAGR